ncbi:MAG: hypothetical protein O2780_01965 [Proteobacteria bacterium]|jgi:hypothetical protein|nr:hypothetical protein [Pseudomonadota bacterium]MDA1299180.1 hypothetical protein [Pseudomonadota bacterium]
MFAVEYVIAWLIYFGSGAACCVIWWHMTSAWMADGASRDLLRGFFVVLIFTPWYAGESPEFFAPAIVVLTMDLLLEGARSGMKGGVALLVTTFVMVLVMLARTLLRRRTRAGARRSGGSTAQGSENPPVPAKAPEGPGEALID